MQPKSTPGSVASFFLRFLPVTMMLLMLSFAGFSQAGRSAVTDPQPAGAVLSQPRLVVPQVTVPVQVNPSDNDLGRPNKALKGTPVASKNTLANRTTACTFTGALDASDPTLSTRLFRGGISSTCGGTQAFPGTSGAGPYYYDTYSIRNTTGACQCVTFTLTTTDATANIQFAVYNGSFNPANLATNYFADPGLSTGTPPSALSCSATVANGQDLVLIVYTVNGSQPASDYSLAVSNLNCNPPSSCSFTGALAGTDASMTDRLNRPGGGAGVCGSTRAFPGVIAGGPFLYDVYTIKNTTGASQCVTLNLTNADATSNIQFAVYNGTFDPLNLATNYMSDPYQSQPGPGTVTTSVTVPNNTTLKLVVFGVNASEATSSYTLSETGLPCDCSGTPAPGNTVTCNNPVCAGVPFSLSLQNNPFAGSFTYQWQSSPDNVTYTNIAGATASSVSRTQNAATWYRCVVTCAASGLTANSTPLQVTMNAPTACYCAADALDQVFEKISNVTFNTINNNSTSTNGYENFTAISTTLVKQQAAPITVTLAGGFSSDQVLVWIDFNQDGDFFDVGENVYSSTPGTGPHTGTITIPNSALTGTTRMRIRMHDTFGALPNATPCGSSDYGQVEDYTVNIQPCIQGTFTTQPSNATATCGSNATITFAATGSVLTYQWEQRVSASAPWTTVTNGGIYAGATTASLVLTGVPVSMNGYQYRALMSGPCTAVDASNVVTLTVNPLLATVTPTSATICLGSIQPLSITNVTSAPTTTTFSSGAISVAIPDNTVAGTSHTIAVSGIPVGSIINSMSVKCTIPHTWVGDLVMVLKAPNGAVLNLDYYLTATGGAGVTTGFSNTIISSTGTAALGTGSNPYTGTFKADGAGPASSPAAGPTGFAPTVGTFAGLYSTPNGNYTLAIYDGGGGDVGTLTNWSLDITYTAPVFASGTWSASPASPNTMFTDAAATVPYTGNAVTTIYVKPTVNTVYSVVVATATCTTPALNIPVNVTNPATSVVAPANTAACVGKNATFTVSSAGGPNTYQWQVSTNGGTTYTNISGATAATLTLTGVAQSQNGNLYRCVVTAAPCGAVTSGAATLTVNGLPNVTIATTTPSLVPGRTSTITATSSPAAASYVWNLNGSPISGATASSYVANIDGLGTYKATVTDVNGCVNSSSNSITLTAEESDRLWIYPNPNDGNFQVRLYHSADLNEKRVVSVYTENGVLVETREYSLDNLTSPYLKMDFKLPRLAPGAYVVKVAHKYTGKETSGVMIIHH